MLVLEPFSNKQKIGTLLNFDVQNTKIIISECENNFFIRLFFWRYVNQLVKLKIQSWHDSINEWWYSIKYRYYGDIGKKLEKQQMVFAHNYRFLLFLNWPHHIFVSHPHAIYMDVPQSIVFSIMSPVIFTTQHILSEFYII